MSADCEDAKQEQPAAPANTNEPNSSSSSSSKPPLKRLISALKHCENVGGDKNPTIKRNVTFAEGLITGKSDVQHIDGDNRDKQETDADNNNNNDDVAFDDDENDDKLVLHPNDLTALDWRFSGSGSGTFSGSETSDDEKDFGKDMDKYRTWSRQFEINEERKVKMADKLVYSEHEIERTRARIALLKQELAEDDDNDNVDGDGDADGNDDNHNHKNENQRKRRREHDIEHSYKKWKKKQNHKGVIFICSVPFGCTSIQIKKIFSEFGTVTNVHLEAAKNEHGQVKKIQNKWTQFTEAWVEFKDKKIAKQVVELLNETRIPKKYVNNRLARSHIWNLKYLKGFGWHHLTEYKNTIRTLQRKKYEMKIADAHRQSAYFEAQLSRAKKMTQGMQGGYVDKEEDEDEEEEEEEEAVFESSDDEAPPVKKQKTVEQKAVRRPRNHKNTNILTKMMK
mmetsp:Transcript_50004/g.83284  ORF Transcript_50004/g.83284 Transcript_50004/m.83284 type:complete len:452 (+) Transcript_50004:45-1400(+)